MVLFVERFGKVMPKLGNFHYHHLHRHESGAFSAWLEVFQSDISSFLNRLVSNSKPRSDVFTIPWIQQWVEAISTIHKAFAKLVVNIDYPVGKWESSSTDRFFNYTLTLMELCNLMSSSLSSLAHARISLSHALTLTETSPSPAITERLRPIKSTDFLCNFKEEEGKQDGVEETISDKELVILRGLLITRGYVLLICGFVLSGLIGNSKPYLQMRKLAGEFSLSSIKSLDSSFLELISKSGPFLIEIKQVNHAISSVVEAIVNGKRKHEEDDELRRKLQVFEKGTDDLRKTVDSLFLEIMGERDRLLDSFRHQNK